MSKILSILNLEIKVNKMLLWIKVILLITLLTDRSLVKGAIDYDDLDTARKYSLERHNELRKRHGSPPLVLNDELTKGAQEYAATFGKTVDGKKVKGHSSGAKGGQYSENLWSTWGGKVSNVTKYSVAAMDAWYNEVCRFDFSTHHPYPGGPQGVGHFTAMVWNTSKIIGIGINRDPWSMTVVTRYKPAGNMLGSFRKSIPKPVSQADYYKRCPNAPKPKGSKGFGSDSSD